MPEVGRVPASNWPQIERVLLERRLALLAEDIRIICDFVDHWGRRPTAAELLAQHGDRRGVERPPPPSPPKPSRDLDPGT